MDKPMNLLRGALLAGALVLPTGSCKDFLDVNTNPNGPETVAAPLYLPPMLHWMFTAPLFDGRFVGRYTQMWLLCCPNPPSTWDRMGYDPGSDNGGEHWRDVYWSLGQNLSDMINKAEAGPRRGVERRAAGGDGLLAATQADADRPCEPAGGLRRRPDERRVAPDHPVVLSAVGGERD